MNDLSNKPDWALTGRDRRKMAAAENGAAPRRGRRRYWVILALILVGGAVMAARAGLLPTGAAPDDQATATQTPAPAEAPREVVMQLLPSELVTVAPGTLRETIKLTGTLEPARKLGLPAEVSGRVDRVTLQEGQAAMTGDVLVHIDIEALTNQLEQQRATANATRAQLELARAEYERTQSLVNRGVATASTLDQENAQVQQLEANLIALEKQVEIAEESLEKATITAPFDGVIAERSVDPGAYVSPGTGLLTLVDISSLTLEGAVPVNYAPRVMVGQDVEITVDGLGSRQFTGAIERIAPVAAQGTRMLPIYASLDNADSALRGGMFASGELVLEQKDDAIGIPADALREDTEGTFVLKLEGERVQRQPVTVARSWDRGRIVEITDGIGQGDVIAASPLERLQSGMKILVLGE